MKKGTMMVVLTEDHLS